MTNHVSNQGEKDEDADVVDVASIKEVTRKSCSDLLHSHGTIPLNSSEPLQTCWSCLVRVPVACSLGNAMRLCAIKILTKQHRLRIKKKKY